jgi:hypothetical protein
MWQAMSMTLCVAAYVLCVYVSMCSGSDEYEKP